MNNALKEAVKAHWEAETCGTRYNDLENARYKLEPYICDFADFKSGRGKQVLEIGVGAGVDFLNWVKHEAHTTGIDITEAAILHTDNLLKHYKLQDTSYKLTIADAENLPFPDNTFDIVYSLGVLHHTPNTLQAFREAFRVLKPNGHLKAMIYHVPSWTGFMLWIKYCLCNGKPFKGLKYAIFNHLESPGTKAYTIPETRDMLEKIGFKNIELSTKLCAGDLLEIKPSKKYQSFIYKIIWALYPRWLVKLLGDRFGLNLLIKAQKDI